MKNTFSISEVIQTGLNTTVANFGVLFLAQLTAIIVFLLVALSLATVSFLMIGLRAAGTGYVVIGITALCGLLVYAGIKLGYITLILNAHDKRNPRVSSIFSKIGKGYALIIYWIITLILLSLPVMLYFLAISGYLSVIFHTFYKIVNLVISLVPQEKQSLVTFALEIAGFAIAVIAVGTFVLGSISRLIFTPYILADKNEGLLHAYSTSWHITKGNTIKIVLLLLPLGLLKLLGYAIIFARFLTSPWVKLSLAHVYRQLSTSNSRNN